MSTVATRTERLAVSGRVDRLDQRGDEVVVVDYKTGRRGLTTDDARGGIALLPSDDTGFPIRFAPTAEPKSVPNQIHFDLTSASLDEQQRTVARALELGGRHIDIGQRPEELHVVLADPETGRQREVLTTPLLRREFAAAAAEHRDRVAAVLRRCGAAQLTLRTDSDWIADVVRFALARKRAWSGGGR